MPVPTEAQEQATLVEWLTLKRWLFTATAQATPAGRMTAAGWKPAFGTLRKNKALGVRKGFPDLCVVTPSGQVAFIEMKRKNGVFSDISTEQLEWLNALNGFGVPSVVCCGAAEAMDFCMALQSENWSWRGKLYGMQPSGCAYAR